MKHAITLLLFLVGCRSSLPAATFTVTTTNDSGPGSLRQVLADAGQQTTTTPHLINFNIPGNGPHTIAPLAALAPLAQAMIIDGWSQPGASPNTLAQGNNAIVQIRLDGIHIPYTGGDGLRLHAGHSTVRGLAIVNWRYGDSIEILYQSSNHVAGCFIGMDADGTPAAGTAGVYVRDSTGNEIGGLTPADRNVIGRMDNYWGVRFNGAATSNNVVRGNYIGTTPSGLIGRSNGQVGVDITGAPNNTVGGSEPGAGNLISFNQRGVRIQGATASGNVVQGNLIGTDVTGTTGLGNDYDGIQIDGAPRNLIGGPAPACRNVISSNLWDGISITGSAAVSNVIQGNWIGTDINGLPRLPNRNGIYIASSAVGNAIGESNLIAGNALAGVYVTSGTRNAIQGNTLFDNGTLGIDLAPLGVSVNDAGDADGGANLLQNFPVITNAQATASSVTLQGVLESKASQSYTLEFFANTVPDASGYGEAEFRLGSANVTADASGLASFSATLPGALPGAWVTATTTDADGNTSELSPAVRASVNVPPLTFTVTTTNDSGVGSLRQAILDSNNHLSASNNLITFNIPGSGMRIIQPASALPSFLQPATVDGFTQPGARANTSTNGCDALWLIELSGALLSFSQDGLNLTCPGMEVHGLRITAFKRDGIRISGNAGGCVVSGNALVGNEYANVRVLGTQGNRIGGRSAADRNWIAESVAGVVLEAGARSNSVLGNLNGTDERGASPADSQYLGVLIQDASDNQIGDPASPLPNLIAFASNGGVVVTGGATNNVIRGNRIFGNWAPGIDLGASGQTPNDTGDADSGPNGLQNYPVITNATANGSTIQIQGRLNTRPNTACTLDFYANRQSSYDPQGEFWLGSAVVTTDAGGNAEFSVTITGSPQGRYFTATATDPRGNTSEFCPAFAGDVLVSAQTFLVTNTNDDGPGSLREALLNVDVLPNTGVDRVHFAIPGNGVQVIKPVSALPGPSQSVVIDGFTQPGASPNTLATGNNAVLKVQLDGALLGSATHGFYLTQHSNTVRGLSLTRFPGYAVRLEGDRNVIEGNWIGVEPNGGAAGNGWAGIAVFGASNHIGGKLPTARNVVSANVGPGVVLENTTSTGNVLQGNFIGTDGSGQQPMGNAYHGVEIIRAAGNLIGGTESGAVNVIAANAGDGVYLEGAGAISNRVEGCRIGTGFATNQGLGNMGNGVLISGANRNTIGGWEAAAGNVIADNLESGVRVYSGTGNTFLSNLIFDNVGEPIALGANANGNIQSPVLTSVTVGSTVVEGTIHGDPNTTYRVQAFRADEPLLSGRRPRTILGDFGVMTDTSGTAVFEHAFPIESEAFALVEATLTGENGTSEVSDTTFVRPTNAVDLRVSITVSNVSPNPGPAYGQQVEASALFNLRVLNAGAVFATQTLLWHFLPGGSFLASTQNPHGSTETAHGKVQFSLGSLAPGEEKEIQSIVDFHLPGPTETSLVAKAPQQTEANPWDNSLTYSLYVIPGNDSADVGVTVQNPGRVPPDTLGTYSLTVRNNGPAVATGVTLVVKVNGIESVTFSQGTHINEPGGLFTAPVEVHTFSLGTLTSGQAAMVTMTGHPEFFEAWHHAGLSASVTSTQPDPNLENNLATSWMYTTAPALRAQREPANGNIQISWPKFGDVMRIELRRKLGSLSASDWEAVPETSIHEEANRFVFSTPPSEQAEFFTLAPRLRLSYDTSFTGAQQLALRLDGLDYPFTDWGSIGVWLPGSNQLYYVNFSVNGEWKIVNAPVLGNVGREPERYFIPFHMGDFGRPVDWINYGFQMTTELQVTMPPSTGQVAVLPDLRILNSGEYDFGLNPTPAEAPPGGATGGAPAVQSDLFPNREQGLSECAPAALVNSLEFLNGHFHLGMTSNAISLDKIKSVIHWKTNGAPVGPNPQRPDWALYKKLYLEREKLPVTTIFSRDAMDALVALNQNCDVELRMNGHVACLRAVIPLGNGTYQLVIAHDVLQGKAGGTILEPILYDPATGALSGPIWAVDRELGTFVIECPLRE